MNPFVEYDNIVPLLAPQDITTMATASSYMDLKYAHRAAFLVVFGNVHGSTSGDREVVTVQGATDPAGIEAAIAFNYRLSGALGTNIWGAITAAAAADGVSIVPSTDDNKLLWIQIDPDALAANDYRYVRVLLTDTPDMDNCLVAVLGLTEPRYKQTTFKSVTASASA
jgi:hypothetical protein